MDIIQIMRVLEGDSISRLGGAEDAVDHAMGRLKALFQEHEMLIAEHLKQGSWRLRKRLIPSLFRDCEIDSPSIEALVTVFSEFRNLTKREYGEVAATTNGCELYWDTIELLLQTRDPNALLVTIAELDQPISEILEDEEIASEEMWKSIVASIVECDLMAGWIRQSIDRVRGSESKVGQVVREFLECH